MQKTQKSFITPVMASQLHDVNVPTDRHILAREYSLHSASFEISSTTYSESKNKMKEMLITLKGFLSLTKRHYEIK